MDEFGTDPGVPVTPQTALQELSDPALEILADQLRVSPEVTDAEHNALWNRIEASVTYSGESGVWMPWMPQPFPFDRGSSSSGFARLKSSAAKRKHFWNATHGRIERTAANLRSKSLPPQAVSVAAAGAAVAAGAAFRLDKWGLGSVLLVGGGALEILDAEMLKDLDEPRVPVFHDFCLDRVADCALFFGIGYAGSLRDTPARSVAMSALTSSLLASFTRAQAAALLLPPVDKGVGRFERVVCILAGTSFAKFTGQPRWAMYGTGAAGLSSIYSMFRRVVTGSQSDTAKMYGWEFADEVIPRVIQGLSFTSPKPLRIEDGIGDDPTNLHEYPGVLVQVRGGVCHLQVIGPRVDGHEIGGKYEVS